MRSGLNFKACAFLVFLSVSYAFTNQLLFSIMVVADPGILSLFKSFTPVVVALLNGAMFSSRLSLDSYATILIMCLGVSTVTSSSGAYAAPALLLMGLSTLLSSLNMVVNARLLHPSVTALSMPLINCAMYSCGAVVNLFLFLLR